MARGSCSLDRVVRRRDGRLLAILYGIAFQVLHLGRRKKI
jgi:hypothetical protein